MTSVRVTRRHAVLRVEADGTECGTSLAMTAASAAPGEWHLSSVPARPVLPPESLVRGARRELAEKGAVALNGDGLLVEAGSVTHEVSLNGVPSVVGHRPYLLVRDGDHVIHLRDGTRPPAVLPWSRAVVPEVLRGDDPVLLGPAALLALLLARQEETGTEEPADDRPSPYPPHDLTLPAVPGRTGADLAQAAELLSDPVLWHVPHGTFAGALRPAPRAAWPGRGPVPGRALVLDSLARHGRHADGRLTWRAAFSARDGSGGTGRGTSPLVVHGDPAELLGRVLHACGAGRPALVRDPIARESYARAPRVMTSLRADEVIASAVRSPSHRED
ncbi:hypothetical protein [Streptomyces sp. NPDC002537]